MRFSPIPSRSAPPGARSLDDAGVRERRRGASAAIIAVLLVPLCAVAALAIDASWWQVGRAQLQTTADAAALAGARALQVTANSQNRAAQVRAYARSMAAVDSAFSLPITLADDDIVPCYYNPPNVASPAYRTQCTGDGLSPAATVDWTSTAPAPNAIRVTATRAGAPMTLGGMFRSGGPTVSSRPAYAWIANIQSGKCIKPWALPYAVLYDRVANSTGLTNPDAAVPPQSRPDLTQAMVAGINNLSVAQRSVIMRGPTVEATTSLPTTASHTDPFPNPNQWNGYSFAGNSGVESFQGVIWNCDATTVTVGVASGNTITSNGSGNVECWTANAIMGTDANQCNNANFLTPSAAKPVTCHFAAPVITGNGPSQTQAVNAGCYSSSNLASMGDTTDVVWGDCSATCNGANAVSYRVISKFVVLCLFRAFSAGGQSGAPFSTVYSQGVTTESCQVPGGTVYRNLPIGTVVGVVLPISSTELSPSTVVGNTTSTAQRLILVSWPN
jgi:Flp pilus assembly protein TadG